MVSSLLGIAIVALPAGIVTAGYMEAVSKQDDEHIRSVCVEIATVTPDKPDELAPIALGRDVNNDCRK